MDSLPAPRGFVNDFAGVIDAAAAARMEATLQEVQQLTHGDIAVVTLPDLGGREIADVALQIGRQWKLGGAGAPGDSARNLGVVILLVPRRNHQPGTGAVFISTGRGAEGFLPDARVGRIRDAMTPSFANEDYSGGLEIGVGLLARAFADEFHVALSDSALAAASPAAEPGFPNSVPPLVMFLVVLFFLITIARLRGGRRWGGGPWWWGGGWGGSGGWRGGGFGGGGGGFGGGFGGFGGGGGFSGGGAGGRF